MDTVNAALENAIGNITKIHMEFSSIISNKLWKRMNNFLNNTTSRLTLKILNKSYWLKWFCNT